MILLRLRFPTRSSNCSFAGLYDCARLRPPSTETENVECGYAACGADSLAGAAAARPLAGPSIPRPSGPATCAAAPALPQPPGRDGLEVAGRVAAVGRTELALPAQPCRSASQVLWPLVPTAPYKAAAVGAVLPKPPTCV